ncbi:MAG: hypothetical protein JWR15_2411 [Prosthecobacter sp.]|nr:hypothetical protein [Prosthecobacter sp.]
MWSSLYPNVAAITGLIMWYGVFASLDGRDRLRWRMPMLPLLLGKGAMLVKSSKQMRWWRPVLPLLLGAVSFRVLGGYMSALQAPQPAPLSGEGRLLGFIVDVGLREEAIKLVLALPFLVRLTTPQARAFAPLAAALVGVGFATAENRWFFGGHHEPTLLVGRVFSTELLHAAATGLCGAAVVRAWRGGWQAWAGCAATCLMVAAAHGLYDWAPVSGRTWLLMGGTSWLSQVVVIALVAWFFKLYCGMERAGARGRAAALWLACGALLQYALALGLTWTQWGTSTAVWVCARECLLFLPAIGFTMAFLASISPRAAMRSEEGRG